MKLNDLNEAITEAERFIRAARQAKTRYQLEQWQYRFERCNESSAMKRANMALTRALAVLRKGN